jgi:hypothetical protein
MFSAQEREQQALGKECNRRFVIEPGREGANSDPKNRTESSDAVAIVPKRISTSFVSEEEGNDPGSR